MNRLKAFTLVLAVMVAPLPLSAQKSTIKTEKQAIGTYPYSDPDPLPILLKSHDEIYPYYTYNKYATTRRMQEWTVITMENDYIRLYILPELGGKVWGAVEKKTGKEFLYHNKVIKFREIALRGPWTSGGMEYNFGIVGHTMDVSAPVQYQTRENTDGGVSCILSNVDLSGHTRWSVEVTLPPDKAYIETNTMWFNNSPWEQSYYSWTCNATHAGFDLEFCYPGDRLFPHGARESYWPQDTGIAWYKNNKTGNNKSHFVTGWHEDFFGGYYHDQDYGFAHWALYDDMPGRKVWMWSWARSGGIWEELLTDTDGQYVEPQAGRLYNQVDHSIFRPYTADRWRELFFPLMDIGGLKKASPIGGLNAEHSGDTLRVYFSAVAPVDEEMQIIALGDLLYSEQIKIAPLETYKKELVLREGLDYEIHIGDKLYYNSNPEGVKYTRPIAYPARTQQLETPTGHYLEGLRLEEERKYAQAEAQYLKALEKDSIHLQALIRMAGLEARKMRYEQAYDYAWKALYYDKFNPDANYIYAVICKERNMYADALETFTWAVRSLEYRSAAYAQMAEIYIMRRNYELAIAYLEKSLKYNDYNMHARLLMAIAYRYKGDEPLKARNIVEWLERYEPLNPYAPFEYSLQGYEGYTEGFLASEHPYSFWLDAAIVYAKLGLDGDAIQILETAPPHPVVYYWLAYLTSGQYEELSAKYLQRALEMPAEGVFPHRSETVDAITWSLKRDNHWKSYYYLGLIYWHKGQTEMAQQQFDMCGEPEFAPLYVVRGHFDKDNRLGHYTKAREIKEDYWQYWQYEIRELINRGDYQEALNRAEDASDEFPGNEKMGLLFANALFYNQEYEDCLEELEELTILPYEFGWEGHNLYMRAHVYQALDLLRDEDYEEAEAHIKLAREYPEHLGRGRPHTPDERLQNTLLAYIYEKTEQRGKYEEVRQLIYDHNPNDRNNYFSLINYGNMGENQKLEDILAEWEQSDDQMLQLYLARYQRNRQNAEQLEKEINRNARTDYVLDAVEFLSEQGYY